MSVTASMVKELRNKTGAGMSVCKEALIEANGDMQRAEEVLREKGLMAAASKAGRIACEGLVHVNINQEKNIGVILEVNSETDFVAKNKIFSDFVKDISLEIMRLNINNRDELLESNWQDSELKTKEILSQKISVIGENLNIRRFEKIKTNGVLVGYIHAGGKVGVLLELICENSPEILEMGKNICMQIAAMSPKFITRDDVPQEFIEQEKKILLQLTLNEGKEKNIAEKIVEGRLAKRLKEFCLYDQEYVKDSSINIKSYIKKISSEINQDIKIAKFIRYATGEGLEKKQENFADEVNKAKNN